MSWHNISYAAIGGRFACLCMPVSYCPALHKQAASLTANPAGRRRSGRDELCRRQLNENVSVFFLEYTVSLAQCIAMWEVSDISFELVADLTDDPVVTLFVNTPGGRFAVLGEAFEQGSLLVVRAAHIQGGGPNTVGAGKLMVVAQALMERMDYDGLEIEGAVRTSGANPGRRPGSVRFARRAGAAPARLPGKP